MRLVPIFSALALVAAVAACGTSPERRTLTGAGIGAGVGAVGAAVVGAPVLTGAAVGAVAGGVAGAVTDSNDINLD